MKNQNIFQTDKLFFGALIGVLSDIIMNAFELSFQKIGLLKYTLDQFAGSMIVRDKAALMTVAGSIIEYLAGAALCILLGIIFVYLVAISGFRGVVPKGILFGFVLWFLIYGGVKSGLHLSFLQDFNPHHTLLQIFIHLIFGLSLGILTLKFGHNAVGK